MKIFLDELKERGYKNRTIGIVENGSWAPAAAKSIKKVLCDCKNLEILEPVVTVRGALNDESIMQIDELAKALAK